MAMTYDIFQVDAFTDRLFGGNPAAVVPLEKWLPDATLQALAQENNLAETAFFVPADGTDQWHLRWFTPATEVKLCGHATLATAYVLFNCLQSNQTDKLTFHTLSGPLTVTRDGDWLTLDFPCDRLEPVALPEPAQRGLNILPQAVWMGREDYLLLYNSEEEVLALQPDFKALSEVPARGFIATAPGQNSDFSSRCFFPAFGIDEDPVTGSAHTTLTPFWAERLGKTTLDAIQCSARSGYLRCTLQGDRVLLAGQGKLYLEGKFFL